MIIRTYQCLDCDTVFEANINSGNDPDPPCPNCDKVLQWVPARLNIGTVKSKAIDLTQKIIEQDYGLTNLNDNNKEGDIAYKYEPPAPTAEREQLERAVREYVAQTTTPVPVPAPNLPPQAKAGAVDMNFWGGGPTPTAVAAQPIPARAALDGAKIGPETQVNALSMLHDAIKSSPARQDFFKRGIMARWKP